MSSTSESTTRVEAHSASREVDPPINGQDIAVIGIRLMKEPKIMPSTGKSVYGIVKVRYVGSEDGANRFVDNLLERDKSCQKFDYLFAPVGRWVPLSNDENFVGKIEGRKNDDADGAFRVVDKEIVKGEQKSAKDMMDRLDRAKSDPTPHENPESLDYEVYRRITYIRLVETVLSLEEKISMIKKKLGPVHRLLKQLDVRFPDRNLSDSSSMLNGKWLDRYNEARKEMSTKYPEYSPGKRIADIYDDFNTTDLSPIDFEYLRKYPLLKDEDVDLHIRVPVLGSSSVVNNQ